jgi:hypothetical protein
MDLLLAGFVITLVSELQVLPLIYTGAPAEYKLDLDHNFYDLN